MACKIQAGGPHAPGGLLFDDDGGEHSCPYGCCEGENHGVVQRQHYYSYKVCANNHALAKSAWQPVSSSPGRDGVRTVHNCAIPQQTPECKQLPPVAPAE